MRPILRPASDLIYSLLRAVAGFLFLLHGVQKLFPVLGTDDTVDLLSRLGLAGLIELFGGGLITLGLFTPWVAFVASGEMASAYFMAHSQVVSGPSRTGESLRSCTVSYSSISPPAAQVRGVPTE